MSNIKKTTPNKAKFSNCSDCPHRSLFTNTSNLKPSFSLKYLQKKYSLENCTQEEKLSFLNALIKRSGMKWCEIEQAPRHGLGKENISRDALRVEPPSVVKPDTVLWAFRFYNKAPFVGFREGEIFHILWIDREFTLYDHGK